ncbi:hypothetical protein JCM5353_005004 [Sporobolomyces roseus]
MPPIASTSTLRPPSSSSHSSLNPPHSRSSHSSTSTTTRTRRKGVPYKSPARSLPPSPSSSTRSTSSNQVINVSLLLRQLARERTSDLDNKRYKPTTTASAAPYALNEKGKGKANKKAITPSSSSAPFNPSLYPPKSVFLPLPQDTYGRGKRSTPSTSRGRSPQLVVPSKRIPPVNTTSHLLLPPSPRPSSRSNARTLSPPTTAADSSLVVVGSPLARSFTQDGKGEIREVFVGEGRRSRNPSVGGSSTTSVGVGANQGVSVWA